MKNKKVVTTIIIVATIILGGIAVFTAVRLFQLRQQAVAPTAPERPSAQVPDQTLISCNPVTFSYGEGEGDGETDPPDATDPPATDPPDPTSTPEDGGGDDGGTGGGAAGTPTAAPSALPDAGIPTPTLIGSAAGLLLILFSLMLAL